MSDQVEGNPGKVLVVYYSVSGNTARVARDIAKALNADVESLRDRNHGTGFWGYLKAGLNAARGIATTLGDTSFNPRNYDLTIVGTPVWAWHMTPAIRTYLERHGTELGNVAFFVTSGDTDAERIVPSMESIVKRPAVAFTGFNGRQLADAGVYSRRLDDFLKSLKRPATLQTGDGRRAGAQAGAQVSGA